VRTGGLGCASTPRLETCARFIRVSFLSEIGKRTETPGLWDAA
jgi:hypothetical protein